MSDAPAIYPLSAAQLREQLTTDLRTNVPEWRPVDPQTGEVDQASAALIGICARFGEIVTQRLNQVPHKNFLAFLDLLGLSPNPPQPARVPLTFTLAPGSPIDAVVPAGTQVAAAPTAGDSEPVLFEVERDLTLVAATPYALFTTDAERDMVADHSAVLIAPRPQGTAIFCGDRSNEHVLYIGHAKDLTPYNVTALTLTLDLNDVPAEASREIRAADLQWEVWDGTSWAVIPDSSIAPPANLKGQFRFVNLPKIPASDVHGIVSHWVRCRLLKPITPATAVVRDMLQDRLLPQLNSVKVRASLGRSAITPSAAFANNQSLDLTKPFMPFGERPRLGDVFYIGSPEGFGLADATVTLVLAVFPEPPLPTDVTARAPVTLRWEAWTGAGWTPLGTSARGATGTAPFEDSTQAFTRADGTQVRMTLPPAMVPTIINGVSSHWIRVSIAEGNYGQDARFEKKTTGLELISSTLAPPVIKSLSLTYALETASANADLVGYNNLEFANLAGLTASKPVPMFRGLPPQPATVYLAFTLPSARQEFPNRAISLYHSLRAFQYGELTTPLHPDLSILTERVANSVATHRFTLTNDGSESVTFTLGALGGAWRPDVQPTQATLVPGQSQVVTVAVTIPGLPAGTITSDRGFLQLSDGSGRVRSSVAFETRVGTQEAPPRRLRLEYWNGRTWSKLVIADTTDRLSRTGIIEFLGPTDLVSDDKFGVAGYWIRALLETGDAPLAPRLRALAPNTTIAAQLVSLRDEVLGSSDASDHLQFNTIRAPVLRGQRLEVREPGPLPDVELATLALEHGKEAVQAAGGGAVWVRWTEVADLHGSAALDRHYVLDHLTGRVTFGDGAQGRIPPRGINNVRMARYQTGGGQRGNCAAGAIVQMKTTVPYVDRVSNPDAAASGFDAESLSALIERGPRTLRHGGRAVAADDYEDLARQASTEVARAKCVPLRDLRKDPLAGTDDAGSISVIIVPASRAAKPLPSLELLDLTAGFLRARQAADATVAVVGPLYVRVDVSMEVALTSIQSASLIERAIREQLAAFLHPLTGGRDGTGWDFGRKPQLSDLHALVNAVAGVDHIRRLTLSAREDLEGTEDSGRFLVYSGQHQIDFNLA